MFLFWRTVADLIIHIGAILGLVYLSLAVAQQVTERQKRREKAVEWHKNVNQLLSDLCEAAGAGKQLNLDEAYVGYAGSNVTWAAKERLKAEIALHEQYAVLRRQMDLIFAHLGVAEKKFDGGYRLIIVPSQPRPVSTESTGGTSPQ